MSGHYNKAYDDSIDGGNHIQDGIDLTTCPSQYGSTNFANQPSSLSKDNTDNGSYENEEQERQKWGSPVEFLLSCIAMSVCLFLIYIK